MGILVQKSDLWIVLVLVRCAPPVLLVAAAFLMPKVKTDSSPFSPSDSYLNMLILWICLDMSGYVALCSGIIYMHSQVHNNYCICSCSKSKRSFLSDFCRCTVMALSLRSVVCLAVVALGGRFFMIQMDGKRKDQHLLCFINI